MSGADVSAAFAFIDQISAWAHSRRFVLKIAVAEVTPATPSTMK
jgi:hypothetical protein